MQDLLSTNGLIAAEDAYYLVGGDRSVKFLDATLSTQNGMSPEQAFLNRHISDAQFFDVEAIADQESPLPHMVPTSEYFESCISALGVSNDDHIVIYDQSGLYMASSRAWWMFRLFGHDKVYVMEGGLGAWVARGLPVIDGPVVTPTPSSFKATLRRELLVTKDDLLKNLETQNIDVVDARPSGRFDGLMPEPRPNMRAGHIPSSKNLPFIEVLDRTGRFKSDADLEYLFRSLELEPDSNIATSCGSGITACTVALALFKARGQNAAVYDGSWSEWGDEASNTPVEVSA